MSLSSLPLSYCTNVHPGRSVAEVEKGLDEYTVAVRERFGAPLAAGLWLARPVADELAESEDTLRRFRDGLFRRGLTCHTLNAFPYGDFHSDRVKENVYLPDWSQPQRRQYTEHCATLLATLLPDALDEGSISTVPLGFKGFTHPPGFLDRCIEQLLETASFLASLREQTRKIIRLGIEPEPLCLLETTTETLAFFQRLFARADDEGRGEIARTHIGVCYDVCHQAVEFEDVRGSIAALDAAGVRINKVHISCALQLDDPADAAARSALLRFVEPRYLHQTTALTRDGDVVRVLDLDEALVESPGDDFRDARTWRVHFHVPVDADRMGTLATTRPALRDALAAVAGLRYAPHLEVETYTWDVMPGRQSVDLAEALARELTAARWMIVEAAEPSPQAQKRV
jgi:sugar phosphate isomerase/epimerase